MDIQDAARKWFDVPEPLPITAAGPHAVATFYAGVACGALGARMSQEEILKAVREAIPPAPAMRKAGFMECPTCAAKPGSPALCASCLHNRRAIESAEASPEWSALYHAAAALLSKIADMPGAGPQLAPEWVALRDALAKVAAL